MVILLLLPALALGQDAPAAALPSTGSHAVDIAAVIGALYGAIKAIAYLLTLVLPDGSPGWNVAKHITSGPPRPIQLDQSQAAEAQSKGTKP